MVNVDISNIWCSVTLPMLLESEQQISAAHAALMDGEAAAFLPWLDGDNSAVLEQVEEAAKAIRAQAGVLVVVGSDSAVAGVRAVVELLRGRDHNLRPGTQIVFAGSDLSTRSWQHLAELLEKRDFCVHLLGRDGADVQSAVTTRALRWMLERRYGTEKSRERVYVSTDPVIGPLREIAAAEGYQTFDLLPTVGDHASVLDPGALLAAAVAGIDLRKLLDGALTARLAMEIRSFENPAWLYAAGRTILASRGKVTEYLTTLEPDAGALGRWWKQLFGSRACANGEGLLPALAEIPGDLHTMHGMFSDGTQPLVQTVLRFDPPDQKVAVEMDWQNQDGYNYLEGFTLDYVQEQAMAAVVAVGADSGVPIFQVDCGRVEPGDVGQLLYFFELTSCLCAGMVGRDVYASEGPSRWSEQMARLLGRPEE